MSDFEIFQKLKWNQGAMAAGRGYVSPNIGHPHAAEVIPSVPELISLPTRFYFHSDLSNVPIHGSTLPLETPKIQKINFLVKSCPHSSNLVLKNLTSVSTIEKNRRTRKQQDIHLPPDFPSYCQYLKGNREQNTLDGP